MHKNYNFSFCFYLWKLYIFILEKKKYVESLLLLTSFYFLFKKIIIEILILYSVT